MKQGWRS